MQIRHRSGVHVPDGSGQLHDTRPVQRRRVRSARYPRRQEELRAATASA